MVGYENVVDESRLKKSLRIAPSNPGTSYGCNNETNEWFEEGSDERISFFDLFRQSGNPVAVLTGRTDEDTASGLRETFTDLLSQWKKETWFLSSVKKRMAHPAYLKIIGMGPSALPLIFEALRQEPEHWFGALEAITRTNPAPNAADMYELRSAWLEWAQAHGY
jgi:hypothetical protein